MNEIYERLEKAFKCIREKTDFVPQVALVLGSGLGGFADEIDIECSIDYSEIDGFPISTVAGHKGRFVLGRLGGVKVVCMQGRVHYYEGYRMDEVVMPIRLMGLMGAKTLFLTNAAGGINESFRVGDFMLIRDHISTFVPNVLIGQNIDELGVRFPDMTDIYNTSLREIIKEEAKKLSIELREGVYVQLTGPSYESPAEIKMLGVLGADAVGMSTVCEALAANHMEMDICAISCISNMAAGIAKHPLTHKEVQETADRVAGQFKALVKASVQAIAKA
ncbi:MAG: purine-nucleoside phosphorylase [Oscillospiraceae bacterium]|nr:purine-nucleoside phosphorylase [Oscillospiraceae bacterium]